MKSIIITGCTSGVGRAFHDSIASFTSSDTQCVFLGRELERLAKSKKHLYYEIDLSNKSEIDWDTLYRLERPESITFISNAGTIHPLGPISSDNSESFREAININLASPAEVISSLVFWTQKNKLNLKVINVSSGAALRPIAGWGAYCTSKAGIRMFLDVVSMEHQNIDIIHFDPGVIDTNMQKSIRRANAKDVPSVDSFIGFAEEGKLRSPIDVATELAQMCGLSL
jgi:benzil reductase ((S)-benzoin forming)